MKFLAYKKWRETPGGQKSSFETIGQPTKRTNSYLKFTSYLTKLSVNTKVLAICQYDRGLSNELAGLPSECKEFVKKCWRDETVNGL